MSVARQLRSLVTGRAARFAALALLAALLPSESALANPLVPASPQARLLAELFWVMLGMALVVLFAVEFLIVYTALRFRRQPGVPIDAEPAQIHGNTRLEVMWTVLPAVVLVVLFVLSIRTMGQISAAPADAMKIQVVGRQFSWEFSYPDGDIKTTNDLRVPVGQPILLEITAADVIHSFWVPGLAGKIDANPGLTNRLTFTAERAGEFRGVCAELCGAGHSTMLFTVTAMDLADYQTWQREGGEVAAQRAAEAASGPSPELGKRLVAEKGCGACHTIQGVAGMVGTIGPNLSKVAATADTRKPGTSADAYLNESIVQPAAFLAPGFANLMAPNGGADLSDQDRAAIVQYLLTLK